MCAWIAYPGDQAETKQLCLDGARDHSGICNQGSIWVASPTNCVTPWAAQETNESRGLLEQECELCIQGLCLYNCCISSSSWVTTRPLTILPTAPRCHHPIPEGLTAKPPHSFDRTYILTRWCLHSTEAIFYYLTQHSNFHGQVLLWVVLPMSITTVPIIPLIDIALFMAACMLLYYKM